MLNRSILLTCTLALAGCPGIEPSATGAGGEDGGGKPPTTGPSSGGAGAMGAGAAGGTGGESAGGNGGEGGQIVEPCEGVDFQTDENHCGACMRPCLTEGGFVKAAKCENGVCISKCDSGHLNLELPAALTDRNEIQEDDGCETEGVRAFVTLATFNMFGGLEDADDQCQQLAEAQQLEGTWLAWLSRTNDPVAIRFTHSEVPYYRLDGAMIAADWDALVGVAQDGLLDNPIDVAENGATLGGNDVPVWTGTLADASASMLTCAEWSFLGGKVGLAGLTGDARALDVTWTDNGERLCAQAARLYCFEQNPQMP